jgi:hypothetical protein
MLRPLSGLLAAAALVLLASSPAARGEEKDETAPNPRYVYWANHKPGSTLTHVEKTTFGDAGAKLLVPDGVEVKEVTYKLLSASPDKVVVETVVTEYDFLSAIKQAPTEITFPAKLKKSHLEAVMRQANAKPGEETIDVLGKPVKCKTLEGAYTEGGDQIERKIWFAETVPGGIVKQVRVTKHDGKLVAETVVTVKAFKAE